jgi:hypothetical protein
MVFLDSTLFTAGLASRRFRQAMQPESVQSLQCFGGRIQVGVRSILPVWPQLRLG